MIRLISIALCCSLMLSMPVTGQEMMVTTAQQAKQQAPTAQVIWLGLGSAASSQEQFVAAQRLQKTFTDAGGRLTIVPNPRVLGVIGTSFLEESIEDWLKQQPLMIKRGDRLISYRGLDYQWPGRVPVTVADVWRNKKVSPRPDAQQICHPYIESSRLTQALSEYDARYLVTFNDQITQPMQRLAQRLVMLPENDAVPLEQLQSEWISQLPIAPKRALPNASGLSQTQLQDWLKTARIVSQSETAVGITKPKKLLLEKDGVQVKGVFKYVDSHWGNHRGRWERNDGDADRFQYEMAAYYLDQLLGLGLVPLTVERSLNGDAGIVQFWIDGLVSELTLRNNKQSLASICSQADQDHLINSFDYLIHNTDRNQSNTLYSQEDGQIWFIDHSRAFDVTLKRPEMLRGKQIRVPAGFLMALKSLREEDLKPLRKWLHRKQVAALWKRRNAMLEGEF